jgi:hypothetical protein
MEFGTVISESFGYAKEAVWGKWARWILLLISTIIFPLIMGYMVRIFRGVKPAPELEKWGDLFIDGLKLIVICIIYAIPLLIVAIFAFAPVVAVAASQAPLAAQSGQVAPYMSATMARAVTTMLIGIVILAILAIIITIIEYIGIVRFARMNSMGEAFNFSAIFEHIGRIGWGTYILALIVYLILSVIYCAIIAVLMAIPVLGWIIFFISMPVWIIFESRYLVHVYDSAAPAAAPAAQPAQ